MKTVNYSELRNKLKDNLDMVCEDHETLIVHRPGGKSVVMMSLDEYNSQKETEYLLSTDNNKNRLIKAIENIEKGKLKEQDLIEPQ
jgi:antitoxin YefM